MQIQKEELDILLDVAQAIQTVFVVEIDDVDAHIASITKGRYANTSTLSKEDRRCAVLANEHNAVYSIFRNLWLELGESIRSLIIGNYGSITRSLRWMIESTVFYADMQKNSPSAVDRFNYYLSNKSGLTLSAYHYLQNYISDSNYELLNQMLKLKGVGINIKYKDLVNNLGIFDDNLPNEIKGIPGELNLLYQDFSGLSSTKPRSAKTAIASLISLGVKPVRSCNCDPPILALPTSSTGASVARISSNTDQLMRLTISKIVTALAEKPCTYKQLRANTKIHRNNLRNRLDYLTSDGLVIRHKYSPYKMKTGHPNMFRSPYYILNMNHPDSNEILYTWPEMFADPKGFFSRERYLEDLHKYGPNYYSSKQQKNKKIKECKENKDKQYEEFRRIDREEKARHLREQKIGVTEVKRSFTTNILELTFYYVNNGHSPLDVLISMTASGKSVEGGFNNVWEILDDAGFLRKYVFRQSPPIRTQNK